MVSAINSLTPYPQDREALEVARRLQSLGLEPSGNYAVDRQRLQTAEVQKRQITLASNSEVNLTKLEGTDNNFASALKNLEINRMSDIAKLDQEIGLINAKSSYRLNIADLTEKNSAQDKMVGATQLAQLNKYKLGLIA